MLIYLPIKFPFFILNVANEFKKKERHRHEAKSYPFLIYPTIIVRLESKRQVTVVCKNLHERREGTRGNCNNRINLIVRTEPISTLIAATSNDTVGNNGGVAVGTLSGVRGVAYTAVAYRMSGKVIQSEERLLSVK